MSQLVTKLVILGGLLKSEPPPHSLTLGCLSISLEYKLPPNWSPSLQSLLPTLSSELFVKCDLIYLRIILFSFLRWPYFYLSWAFEWKVLVITHLKEGISWDFPIKMGHIVTSHMLKHFQLSIAHRSIKPRQHMRLYLLLLLYRHPGLFPHDLIHQILLFRGSEKRLLGLTS